ncbi:hypothetical protein HOY34_12600 [Xinfangfangia sp. D13-10-4-6]|uniref:hypothetical protein n=1 Tax=Pseudogemmobacter hezensis TaxID=2737662 RepID=UPI0015571AA1|nr:hypothetical protein [Pseudogemmobacter hezensis]NPD16039.1 hypothetical protein [Pseudogemmobacter hezensis]
MKTQAKAERKSEDWQLLAPEGSAWADTVQLMLAARSWPFRRLPSESRDPGAYPAPPQGGALIPPGIYSPDAGPIAFADGAETLTAITRASGGAAAAGDPANLQLVQLTEAALARLEHLDPGAFPADLDLAIFALRQALHPLEALATARPATRTALADALPDDSACILAPLLWRLGLYDRHLNLFLLSGLPGLSALRTRLLQQPLIAALFHPGAELDWLRRFRAAHHSPRTATDWSRALGPEGREKSLPHKAQRRKDPSIGSADHIR